jgi:hypothetical protein
MFRVSLGICLAVSVAGCSATMPTVADRWKPPAPPGCSANPVKPLVDLGIAAGSAVGAVYAFDRADLDDAAWVTASALGAISAVVFGYGTVLGVWNVRECRQAREELRQWQLNIGTARP